jgi:hypothetical protein
MNVPWYIVSDEGGLLLNYVIMESANSYVYYVSTGITSVTFIYLVSDHELCS